MSTSELPVVQQFPAAKTGLPPHGATWLRAARQAKLLAWASLAWMGVEGFVGVLAGVQAHSLGVVTWAASSFVEAFASLIVVWRFTGHRTLSETSEARAQRWVAASFFLLAPYFVFEAVRKLVNGGDTHATLLAVALTASAVLLMPLLGWAKLRLGKQLDSGATEGEGIQNIMCAVQAGTALVAIAGAGIGLSFLDPAAALVIAAIALKEGRDGWRGHGACCVAVAATQAEFGHALRASGFASIEIRSPDRVHEHQSSAIIRARNPDAAGCCVAETQATCCEANAKPECCGDDHAAGSGGCHASATTTEPRSS